MAQKGLEEFILEHLEPEIEKYVYELLKDEDERREIVDLLEDSLIERVDDYIREEDISKKLVNSSMNAIRKEVNKYVDKLTHSVRKLDVVINDIKLPETSEDAYHYEFEYILKLVGLKIPILLKGPAGTGKNVSATQVAKALNLKLYRLNSPQEDYKIEGFVDAHGKYHASPFYEAFTGEGGKTKGGILLLDEMDNASASALIVVNDAIANGSFKFPNGEAKMAEDFRVIATANTWGNGKSFEYIGRNKIDASTLDRFVFVEYMYDKDLERMLYPDDDILEVFWKLRTKADENKTRAIFSMRGIKYAYMMKKAGIDFEKIVKSTIVKGLGVDEVKQLTSDFEYGDNDFMDAVIDVRKSMSAG